MRVTSEQLTPWQRRLIPSLSDVLFCGLAVGQFHRAMFADGDSGWHLWAGFDALAHGVRAIPDALSFTRAGVPWRNLEWLADAVLALCYRQAGYFGVTVLISLLFAALCTWLYRILLRETGHVPASALAMGMAGVVVLLQLVARPLVFSFLLVLAAWELVRAPGRERIALWVLPPLTVLWVNLHPTAFLAPLLAAFGWLTHGRDRRLALAAVLSLVALGATPWGYAWLREIAPTGENLELLKRIDEWQTPRFSDSRFAFVLAYLLVAVGIRRWGPRLAWGEALLGLGCLLGSLFAARLAPIAAILWAPYLARDLSGWARTEGGWLPGRVWRAAQETLLPFERVLRPGLWPVLFCVCSLVLAPRFASHFPDGARGFRVDTFPYRAMTVADSLELGPRVFNGYGWGGFVSWTRSGRYQVFIDGRACFFGGRTLADYLSIVELRPDWREAAERTRADWMLLPADQPVVVAAPLTGRWRVAYRDSLAAVLVPVPSPGPARGGREAGR
jgi:hypothetical protein